MGVPVSEKTQETIRELALTLHPDIVKGLREFPVDEKDAKQILEFYRSQPEDKIMIGVIRDALAEI